MRSIRLMLWLAGLAASSVIALNLLFCADSQTISEIFAHPAKEVQSHSLKLAASEGTVYYGDVPFTGYATRYFSDGQLAEKIAYVEGKKEGETEKWYRSGGRSFKGTYTQNRRHGTVRTWWPDGVLRSESNYVDGVPHGVQRQWYQSGALFKQLNLDQGKEAGLQRAWRENGKLYANYEAIDGRIYGLKRANLCYDLDGETIQFSGQ